MSRLAARLGPLVVAPTDAELLGRFVAGRDDAAFADLVRRHGPAVLAVCRRLTRHTHDAEDAFQAVFLVLARRAREVRPGNPLGAWLYGVAVRVARRAAERPWRRREATGDVPDVPARAAEPVDPDAARAVLDEVGRLSVAYRAAVVLCELEGRSRAAVARELGIAEGTLSSRLAAAREQLAARLTARGFAPAVLAALAGAGVPPALASATSALATGAPAPAAVAALAHGVGRAMTLKKLIPSAVAVVASAALVTGLLGSQPAPADPPAPPVRVAVAQPPAPKAAPLPTGPNRIVFYLNGRLTMIDPDGKNAVPVTEDNDEHSPLPSPRLSPDGSMVAYLVQTDASRLPMPGDPIVPLPAPEFRLFVRKTAGNDPPTDLGVRGSPFVTFAWSGDGTRIATTSCTSKGKDLTGVHKLVAVATKAVAPLPIPADHVLTDWSHDGRLFVTQQVVMPREGGGRAGFRLRLLNRDGTEHKVANAPTDLLLNGRLSPDGKRVLCEQYLLPDADGKRVIRVPVVLDLTTGAVAPLVDYPPDSELQGYCWSPDGRRVAYAWRGKQPREAAPLPGVEFESFLVVCDADRRNARMIATAKGDGPGLVTIAGPDWR
ncbi:sigma-70 family RNA polymerase sigma factor [bacterium]|nr:sigma-70 family RNA polymerase sigma factor [bacterium]